MACAPNPNLFRKLDARHSKRRARLRSNSRLNFFRAPTLAPTLAPTFRAPIFRAPTFRAPTFRALVYVVLAGFSHLSSQRLQSLPLPTILAACTKRSPRLVECPLTRTSNPHSPRSTTYLPSYPPNSLSFLPIMSTQIHNLTQSNLTNPSKQGPIVSCKCARASCKNLAAEGLRRSLLPASCSRPCSHAFAAKNTECGNRAGAKC